MTPTARRWILREPEPTDLAPEVLAQLLQHPLVRQVRMLAAPETNAPLALYVYLPQRANPSRFALPTLLPTANGTSLTRIPAWVPAAEATRYRTTHWIPDGLPGNERYPARWLCELLWGGTEPPKGS